MPGRAGMDLRCGGVEQRLVDAVAGQACEQLADLIHR